jgi:hypothetical protein
MALYTEGDSAEAPRFSHPQLLRERISIPIVHVTVIKEFEFMCNMSEAARGLFDDERSVNKLEQSGGHQPPQRQDGGEAVVRAWSDPWHSPKGGRTCACDVYVLAGVVLPSQGQDSEAE